MIINWMKPIGWSQWGEVTVRQVVSSSLLATGTTCNILYIQEQIVYNVSLYTCSYQQSKIAYLSLELSCTQVDEWLQQHKALSRCNRRQGQVKIEKEKRLRVQTPAPAGVQDNDKLCVCQSFTSHYLAAWKSSDFCRKCKRTSSCIWACVLQSVSYIFLYECKAHLPVSASFDTSGVVNHTDDSILVRCHIKDGGPWVRRCCSFHITLATCIGQGPNLNVKAVVPRIRWSGGAYATETVIKESYIKHRGEGWIYQLAWWSAHHRGCNAHLQAQVIVQDRPGAELLQPAGLQ